MGRYMTKPECKLTLNSVEYTNSNNFNVRVTGRESGVDMATINFVDTKAKHWISDFDAGDSVLIQVKDESDSTYTTLLRGRIAPAITPSLPNDMLHIKCEGNGWPLTKMMVAAEFGSQVSAALDEVDEIVDEIIDEYVEDIFDSATATGHSINTEIDAATMTATMRYMSFPYIPAYKAINELLEIYQGVRGANVGAHWVVDTAATPELNVQPVGSHSAAAVANGWSNYLLGSDATDATFVQNVDFTTYSFTKAVKEANYILYYGAWKSPCPIDLYTEGTAASWTGLTLVGGVGATINDDAAVFAYGAQSIELISEAGVGAGEGVKAWYPSTVDLNLDLTKVGGDYTRPRVNVLLRPIGTPPGGGANYVDIDGTVFFQPEVILGTGAQANADWYRHDITPTMTLGEWNSVSIPCGDNLGWTKSNNGDWSDIDYIMFRFYNGAGTPRMHIDGLHFSGHVARVVKQAAAYDSSDPCLMKVVTDDYAKDDVIADGDKTGTISKLAYAEYLRASSTPTTGTFTTRLVKDLWAGQKVHVHAKKQEAGTFRIDSDFRVLEFEHVIGSAGGFTNWRVTSDVTNSHVQPAYNSVNKNLAAVRPGTQDMQATSMKMREIDITQARLVNTY